MAKVAPLRRMLFNLRLRVAPPLKRPEAWASVTVPTARVPTGTTVLPLTTTGEENVASKLWPGSLILDPTDCTSLTRRVVPAGITTGGGGGGERAQQPEPERLLPWVRVGGVRAKPESWVK